LSYSYTWSPELSQEWRWSEKYAAQPEILKYIQYTAQRYDLRNMIRFNTKVRSAVFDEESGTWCITTDQNKKIHAKYCVLATGNLSVPNVPKIPGVDAFKGAVYHTGRWPKEAVDFSGLRVGVLGTGSSAVQAIPMIAKQAKQLVVFQRTPNYSVPAVNVPLGEEDHRKFQRELSSFLESLDSFGRVPPDAFDAPVPSREELRRKLEDAWQKGGASSFLYAFPNVLTNQEVNDAAGEFVREKIRGIIKNKETADALCAVTSPFGVKRLCVDTGYFQTFNQDHVKLVNLKKEPIETITATGITTSLGDYDLDALVFATGFDAITGAILAIDIQGKNGKKLKDVWSDGPVSYLGLMVSGFPNIFTVTGPGSPSVIGNVLLHGEHHVEFISTLIEHMEKNGKKTVDVDRQAQEVWSRHVSEVAEKTLFPKANSWYLGDNIPGKPRVFMPYVGDSYRKKCAQIASEGYKGFVMG
jgi:cyclohexanone monooxygenase